MRNTYYNNIWCTAALEHSNRLYTGHVYHMIYIIIIIIMYSVKILFRTRIRYAWCTRFLFVLFIIFFFFFIPPSEFSKRHGSLDGAQNARGPGKCILLLLQSEWLL